jgi:exodeoxyribonuclease VII large subunit
MSDLAILSVTQLTRQVKDLVEANFPQVAVAGEISNCTRAGSGHIYLTLKDEDSQIRAVIWRSAARRIRFEIEDGLQVLAVGPVELYQARGTFQLIVEQLQPQGVGPLELAFRQLQQKLAAEGLFAAEHKRPLPRFPRRIALITSPAGAAVRDMLQVIGRRWTASQIVVLPVLVQGPGAGEQISAALRKVHRLPDVDVVIVGRGGGSLEDLWAFNEEIVARAIFDCRLPVVSAVGHEIDVTIADLVADRRALTPSEAGELVVPFEPEVRRLLDQAQTQLAMSLRERCRRSRITLDAIAGRRVFTRPTELIHDWQVEIDDVGLRLRNNMTRLVQDISSRVATTAAALDALSPLKVLSRGFSVTVNTSRNGRYVRSIDDVAPADEIRTLLHRGAVTSRVESIEQTEESAAASGGQPASPTDSSPVSQSGDHADG